MVCGRMRWSFGNVSNVEDDLLSFVECAFHG